MHENPYPVYLVLKGRSCVIVGGNPIAVEKVLPLHRAGAQVTVFTETPPQQMLHWTEEKVITLHRRPFAEDDMAAAYMVIATEGEQTLNHRLFNLAQKHKVLFNAADDIPHCDFYAPAIAESGCVQVAITTSGASPALASKLREHIQNNLLTEEVGQLAQYLAAWRPRVKELIETFEARKQFWLAIIDSDVIGDVHEGHFDRADAQMEAHIQRYRGAVQGV